VYSHKATDAGTWLPTQAETARNGKGGGSSGTGWAVHLHEDFGGQRTPSGGPTVFSANAEQRDLFRVVVDALKRVATERYLDPLRLLVSGTAGTGKPFCVMLVD
jgi:hypothetical protein